MSNCDTVYCAHGWYSDPIRRRRKARHTINQSMNHAESPHVTGRIAGWCWYNGNMVQAAGIRWSPANDHIFVISWPVSADVQESVDAVLVTWRWSHWPIHPKRTCSELSRKNAAANGWIGFWYVRFIHLSPGRIKEEAKVGSRLELESESRNFADLVRFLRAGIRRRWLICLLASKLAS
jgi:hypothetical protein